MIESILLHEVEVIYRHEYEEGQPFCADVTGYKLDGKPITAEELHEQGFEAPDSWDVSWALANEEQERNMP